MLFISLHHCLYLLLPQVKMPRKMSPLHESAAPRAPKPMAPIAMPCSLYLNPGLMQMWVLEVTEEGNSGKCMPVTEEGGSFPHDSMRITMKDLFSFTYICPPFTREISICDSFCPSSPSWPARRDPQDTLCLCSVDLRLLLCPPWLKEVQTAASMCGLGYMTQHRWDTISSHLICLSLNLFPGLFSVFLWGKTQLYT